MQLDNRKGQVTDSSRVSWWVFPLGLENAPQVNRAPYTGSRVPATAMLRKLMLPQCDLRQIWRRIALIAVEDPLLWSLSIAACHMTMQARQAVVTIGAPAFAAKVFEKLRVIAAVSLKRRIDGCLVASSKT